MKPSSKRKPRRRVTPAKLASKLRLVRERAGLSESEFARRIGVENRTSISGYERGEREPPLPVLLNYARLAKISVELLIDDALDVA